MTPGRRRKGAGSRGRGKDCREQVGSRSRLEERRGEWREDARVPGVTRGRVSVLQGAIVVRGIAATPGPGAAARGAAPAHPAA